MITNRTYGMDADVIAYNARIVAGGNQSLSMQSLRQLNQFVISIKKMGLWANMVCWPLRANQNAGSANTIYSLGGLQTSNAIKTGGSWGPDGIFFSGSTEYMLSDLTNTPKDITLFVVAKGNGTTYSSFPYIGGVYHPSFYYTSSLALGNATAGNGLLMGVGQPSTYSTTSTISNGLSSSSSFVALCGSYKRNSVFNVRNLSASTIGVQSSYPTDESTTITKMVLNGRWNNGSIEQANPMTSSFFAIITPNCDSIISNFHSLYKTTLGQDLGLP